MQASVSGVAIAYEKMGNQGPAVVLLHGWGCSHALMLPIAEALSPTCRVWLLDWPGHGASGRPPQPWGPLEHAAMLAAFIENVVGEPASLVGHSHGGRIALMTAAATPTLVPKLVLTGAAGLQKPPTEASQKRAKAFQRYKGWAQILSKTPFCRPFADKAQAALRKRYGSPDYNALDEEMRQTFVKLVSFDVQSYLPKIHAPTLLLWGDKDTETPLWMGEQMAQMIPDAALIPLHGGTHFAYLEQRALFVRIARQFLVGEGP